MNIKVTSAKFIPWKSESTHKQIVFPPSWRIEHCLLHFPYLKKKPVEGLDLSFSWQTRCEGFFPRFPTLNNNFFLFQMTSVNISSASSQENEVVPKIWSDRPIFSHFERICTTLKGYYEEYHWNNLTFQYPAELQLGPLMSKTDSTESWNSWKRQETLKEQSKQHLESKIAKNLNYFHILGLEQAKAPLRSILETREECAKFPLGVFSWKEEEQLSDFVFKGNYAFGNWG